MIQHDLLMMYAAPLILLGAPTTPVLRGLPRAVRRVLVRPVMRRRESYVLYRLITHPVIVIAVHTGLLWAWHLAPGWYDAAIRDALVHDVQHLSLAFAGLLVWWNVIDPAPLRSRLGYMWRMALLIAVGTPKAFLGAMITFSGSLLYDFYNDSAPIFALEPIRDQEIGGLIMWVPGQMMFLLAAGAVFAVWAHKAEQRQQAEEAERLAATHGLLTSGAAEARKRRPGLGQDRDVVPEEGQQRDQHAPREEERTREDSRQQPLFEVEVHEEGDYHDELDRGQHDQDRDQQVAEVDPEREGELDDGDHRQCKADADVLPRRQAVRLLGLLCVRSAVAHRALHSLLIGALRHDQAGIR